MGRSSSFSVPLSLRSRKLCNEGLSPKAASGNNSSPVQPCTVRVWRFDEKPPSGNDSSSGQPCIISSFIFDGKYKRADRETQSSLIDSSGESM
ncbi:hypothetical protein VNO80_26045 [Phaseolus coccineus]|uniref:Uncharacterized protein n=1 Tax=Phaseolus coccineus TaxID=3886 RepID=A0AAN9QPJ3_PHACN